MFEDRLVNNEDRHWFQQLLKSQLSVEFKSDPNEILGEATLLYGDFMMPNADVKVYEEITDYEKVLRCLVILFIMCLASSSNMYVDIFVYV